MPYLGFRDRNPGSLEIPLDLAGDLGVTVMLEFDGGQYLGVGLSFGAGPAEPLGRPEPEPLVAAREGLEPDPLVVNELPLESLRARRTSSWAGLLPSAESCVMIAYVSGSNSSANLPDRPPAPPTRHQRDSARLEGERGRSECPGRACTRAN